MAAPASARIGTNLAGYRIEALLGRGGMGVVYRAHDLALGRNVALKLLSPELAEDERFRDRFLTESRLAASIDHPNIIPVYDAGEVAGQLYIAMRYVDGSDLKKLLAEGALPAERAVAIVSQVAGALDAAHERGLVHRDVKPSNVLLDERGHVYLADFGLSRRLGEVGAALGATQSLGTIDYVAPEQIRGEQVDGRADLYSLGCLLHECLTGSLPFARPTEAAVLFAHLEEEPSAPPGLEGVMRIALAKEPDERFQTGRELVEAARKALGLQPRRVGWPAAAAAAGIALIAAALLAFFLSSGGGDGVQVDPRADSLVRIDPESNRVAKAVPVGRGASGVATADGRVWVTNAGDGTVSLVDAKTLKTQTVALSQKPTSVAVGAGTVVVADGASRKVSLLDAETGAVRSSQTVVGDPNWGFLVAGGADGVWFADTVTRLVGRIDASDASTAEQIAVPRVRTDPLAGGAKEFPGLANADGSVWVAGGVVERTLWRIEARSGRVVATIPLGFAPKAVAAGEGAVWVTSLLGDTVSRIDPATNRVVATIPVGRGPYSIAAGGGAVWVTGAIDDTVSRIDPQTNRVVAVVPVEGTPGQVAVGPEGVWVTMAKPVAVTPAPPGAIKIGIYADCTGPFGAVYDSSLAGAMLPLLQRGGRRAGRALTDGVTGVTIGGRPVRLSFGCVAASAVSETTTVLAEERRLVEKVGVDVLIGPTTWVDAEALQEYARRRPATTFLAGPGIDLGVDTAPNFFSFTPSGQAAGLGTYAYRTLGWRKAVTITEMWAASTWSQTAQFTAEFCSLGGTITKRVGVPDGATDLAGVVSEIPPTGMDGVFLSNFSFLPYLEALTAAVPSLRQGNLGGRLLLGTAAAGFLPLTVTGADRARLAGVVSADGWAAPGLAPGSKFATDFAKHFPRIQMTGFASGGYYNAMTATLAALDAVEADLSGGQRRFQAALAQVELDAPNGRTTLDARHRAIAPNYLVRLQGPELARRVIRTIPNVRTGWGGYFTPADPPPTLQTPPCKRGTPPPWAR